MSESPSPPPAARPSRARFLLPLALLLVTATVFAQSVRHGFTNWDDPVYVTGNTLIRHLSPAGLQAIGTSFVAGNYHPLTILSLALDYSASGLDPAGYHRTNLAIHLLATLAVFWFLLLLTESRGLAAVASLFFGIHPLHVESVAWISGRKDLLYGLFYLVSCACYVRWVRQSRKRDLVFALLAFVASLLSKGMAVTLPLTLVAIDLYLRRPWNARVALEKTPFLALALAFGALAVVAQEKAVHATGHSLLERALLGFHGLAAYAVRAVAPVGLSAFYPYPSGPGLPAAYYAAPLVAVLLAWMIAASLRGDRTFAFGGIFFLVNVALVLQFLAVGTAAMADRYTYLAYVGLGLVLARAFERARRGFLAGRPALQALSVVALVALFVSWATIAHARVRVWRDSVTLWSSVLHAYPDLTMAYAQRGWAYHERGDTQQAMADLDRAIALDPNDGDARSARGAVYQARGDYARALEELDVAVRSLPGSASAVNNRGTVLLALGRTNEALADFTKTIELNPRWGDGYLNRALAFGIRKEYRRAIPDLDRAIELDSENPRAYLWRGVARAALGEPGPAILDYDAALRVTPRFGDAYFARSNAHESLKHHAEALRDALAARESGYGVPDSLIARLREATEETSDQTR